MPTTSNFGWTTPADTDLVKDGAAAIRTLGNGIDTSLVDLKGGTTGQNLRKASNTDLDFTFAGDATNTVIDAEGDLLVGDSADTLQRLAIGTTGQVLTCDTTLDGKIKWAAPAAATFLGCRVTKSVAQSIATATATAITWDVEDYDTNTMHDNVTNNSRITIPSGQGGYYLVQANLIITDAGSAASISIYKNGAVLKRQFTGTTIAGDFDLEITAVLNLAAADYIEIFGRQSTGGNRNVQGNSNDPQNSAFQVVKLG
jgi:hypothetical protein